MTPKSTIKNKMQAPRTRLLYFIYSCQNSSLKDEPGIKSKLRKALGYKSDGHFYPDFDYLLDSGLIEKTEGYFKVTKKGKEEFALNEANFSYSCLLVCFGVMLLVYSYLQTIGFDMAGSVAFVGAILIILGAGLSMVRKRNNPHLSLRARSLLNELKKK